MYRNTDVGKTILLLKYTKNLLLNNFERTLKSNMGNWKWIVQDLKVNKKKIEFDLQKLCSVDSNKSEKHKYG